MWAYKYLVWGQRPMAIAGADGSTAAVVFKPCEFYIGVRTELESEAEARVEAREIAGALANFGWREVRLRFLARDRVAA